MLTATNSNARSLLDNDYFSISDRIRKVVSERFTYPVDPMINLINSIDLFMIIE
jgi:hypothetical protein